MKLPSSVAAAWPLRQVRAHRGGRPGFIEIGHGPAGLRLTLPEFRSLMQTKLRVDGQWREIDTGQDLARAIALVESTSEEWS